MPQLKAGRPPLGPMRGWTPPSVAAAPLERSGELARIDEAIASLKRGIGGVLVVQGATGIGKSTLLQTVSAHATGAGLQTFTAQASELERDFSFGMVRQLLETRLARAGDGERAELLAGAAQLAGPVLGLGGAVGDAFAALHGLYWLVANLANHGPVLLALDDLHWADEPSLRWLVYLCHRLEGLPVLVAATTRPPRPGHPPLLAELMSVGGAQILCPGPLSESAATQLIRDGLGAQPHPGFAAACTEVTGGNPFALHELIFDLVADGVAPIAAQAAGVRQRVPERMERTVLARLGRLDHTAVHLAQAVAVLGEGRPLRLPAALAGLDPDAAAGAADALVHAELLGGGRPLRFMHPLVRSAVYEQIPFGARAQAHARAAQLLIRENAEPEQVAVQLLACEPANAADAVQALRAAAAAASARGAPGVAITYLRRALAESPADPVRAAVLGELGSAEHTARDPAAVEHLDQAWQATNDPIARVQLAGKLGNVLHFAGALDRYLAVLRTTLADIGERDPELAVRLRILNVLTELVAARTPDASDAWLRKLSELANWNGPASRSAQLALALVLALRGERCHEVAGLIERGWDNGRFLAEETCEAIPTVAAIWALTHIDDLDRAHALTGAMLADAQGRGSVLGLTSVNSRQGLIALRRGALAEAEADLRTTLELATEHDLPLIVLLPVAYLGLTLLERGQLDQAAAVVERITTDSSMAAPPVAAQFLETRGRVRLARGQRVLAIADLRRCGRFTDGAKLHNPNYFAWRSALALALAAEDPHEAHELAEEELRLARRAGSSRAIGIALRACGLLAGGKDGIDLLEESVAVLEPTQMRLELAHSLTELGAARRRAGARIAAREPLRRALDLAVRCGATPLAERAREEAVASGARPRRPLTTGVDALTPSELRVARLAAQSLGNREIAQALFITAKTVSDHLSSTYRKLDISCRDQLATAMTADQSVH